MQLRHSFSFYAPATTSSLFSYLIIYSAVMFTPIENNRKTCLLHYHPSKSYSKCPFSWTCNIETIKIISSNTHQVLFQWQLVLHKTGRWEQFYLLFCIQKKISCSLKKTNFLEGVWWQSQYLASKFEAKQNWGACTHQLVDLNVLTLFISSTSTVRLF